MRSDVCLTGPEVCCVQPHHLRVTRTRCCRSRRPPWVCAAPRRSEPGGDRESGRGAGSCCSSVNTNTAPQRALTSRSLGQNSYRGLSPQNTDMLGTTSALSLRHRPAHVPVTSQGGWQHFSSLQFSPIFLHSQISPPLPNPGCPGKQGTDGSQQPGGECARGEGG